MSQKREKKKSAKYELEKSIEVKIRLALYKEGVLCWKHNVDNRLMHTGLGEGVSDLICIVPPNGRFLAIEIKSLRPGSKASDQQEEWMASVRRFGGVAGVARSVEEALHLVAQARFT